MTRAVDSGLEYITMRPARPIPEEMVGWRRGIVGAMCTELARVGDSLHLLYHSCAWQPQGDIPEACDWAVVSDVVIVCGEERKCRRKAYDQSGEPQDDPF
jgi:hypothetical protein